MSLDNKSPLPKPVNTQDSYQSYLDYKTLNSPKPQDIKSLKMHKVVKGLGDDIQGFKDLPAFEQKKRLESLKERISLRKTREDGMNPLRWVMNILNNFFIRRVGFKSNAKFAEETLSKLEAAENTPAKIQQLQEKSMSERTKFFEKLLDDVVEQGSNYETGSIQKLFSDPDWLGSTIATDPTRQKEIFQIAQKKNIPDDIQKEILLGLMGNKVVNANFVKFYEELQKFTKEDSSFKEFFNQNFFKNVDQEQIKKLFSENKLVFDHARESKYRTDNYGFFGSNITNLMDVELESYRSDRNQSPGKKDVIKDIANKYLREGYQQFLSKLNPKESIEVFKDFPFPGRLVDTQHSKDQIKLQEQNKYPTNQSYQYEHLETFINQYNSFSEVAKTAIWNHLTSSFNSKDTQVKEIRSTLGALRDTALVFLKQDAEKKEEHLSVYSKLDQDVKDRMRPLFKDFAEEYNNHMLKK